LFQIATNLCINAFKKGQRLVHTDGYQDEDGNSIWVMPDTRADCNPAVATERRDLQREVQAAIDCLPAVYRLVVILRHMHDLSYQEIAEVTDLPIGTVKSRLGRGRSRLAELLRDRV
jgi:RNA polymerase sigma-70 factor (ECF subfamily)